MDVRFALAVPAKDWTQACAYFGAQIIDGQVEIEVESQWQDLKGSSFLFSRG